MKLMKVSRRLLVAVAAASVIAIAAIGGGTAAAASNCSPSAIQIYRMQQNLHASSALVQCGVVPGGNPSASSAGGADPFLLGGTDINLITGTQTLPHLTQSEDMIWAQGKRIVVNYNDSSGDAGSPFFYSGASVSTDSGATFTRLSPQPFTGHGNNYGDPIVVYNKNLGKWFAGDLADGDCGAAIGIGMWQSTNATTWTTAPCAHVNASGGGDDRESMAVDNRSTSAHYGRMYIAWNNFSTPNADLVISHSDNGTTWSSPVTLASNASVFTRDTGVTVTPNGTVLAYALSETSEGSAKDYPVFRSTNGGTSFSPAINMASAQAAPGRTGGGACAGFQNIPPIWRYEGNGQLAAGKGGIVGYDYTRHDAGDQGNIYFVRSTNNGSTWSAPVKLNTDAGTRAQWMPALAETSAGHIVASWYDRRNTTNNDYQRFARVSNDGGVTWGANQRVSDVTIKQPLQPDPLVQACYAGDYNLDYANGTNVLDAWTDGRVAVGGKHQQDVFYDTIPVP
jgi:hypothetical protein